MGILCVTNRRVQWWGTRPLRHQKQLYEQLQSVKFSGLLYNHIVYRSLYRIVTYKSPSSIHSPIDIVTRFAVLNRHPLKLAQSFPIFSIIHCMVPAFWNVGSMLSLRVPWPPKTDHETFFNKIPGPFHQGSSLCLSVIVFVFHKHTLSPSLHLHFIRFPRVLWFALARWCRWSATKLFHINGVPNHSCSGVPSSIDLGACLYDHTAISTLLPKHFMFWR